MSRVALLLKASANRVFGESSFALAEAELAHLDRHVLGGIVSGSQRSTVAGVDYLLVDLPDAPTDDQLAVLSNLSSLHALFEVEADARFRPLRFAPRICVDEDLLTIQRYSGKTNEAFTHLLVNLALASGADALPRLLAGERLRLLDPACGRGTTLNRAMAYGMDACGIDVDRADLDAYATFLTTWLQDKRYKHRVEQERLRRGRPTPAHRWRFTYGPGKDVAGHHVVELVHDDASRTLDHVRPRSVDVLACDLPYGVQHGARRVDGPLARDPSTLLAGALPAWLEVLRPGAAAALAWNRRTLPRAEMVRHLEGAGFAVERGGDDALVHRVDRAITRDVVIAVRPADR